MLETLSTATSDFFEMLHVHQTGESKQFSLQDFLNKHQTIERFYPHDNQAWSTMVDTFWNLFENRTAHPEAFQRLVDEFKVAEYYDKIAIVEMLYEQRKMVNPKTKEDDEISIKPEIYESFSECLEILLTDEDRRIFANDRYNYIIILSYYHFPLYAAITRGDPTKRPKRNVKKRFEPEKLIQPEKQTF